MKFFNSFCLAIWFFELFCGIEAAITGESIRPIVFIFAALCCILHFIGELIREELK